MDTCLAKQWRAGRRALAVMVPAGPAAAQFVEQTVDGALDSVQPNPFGISDGDLFSIEAFYDEMLLSGLGLETIDLGEGTGHGFSLDIANGALTFSEVDDLFFGAPFSDPEVFFLDGVFARFGFVSKPFEVGGSFYEVASFSGADPNEPDLEIFNHDLDSSLIAGRLTGRSISPE